MNIRVDEFYNICVSELPNPLILNTPNAGDFAICSRDGGIEITRGGELLFACYDESTKPFNKLCVWDTIEKAD